MSATVKATEVERNAADKEKVTGDKTESLKRASTELNDGVEEGKKKIQKTDKAANENGDSEHKEEDDGDDSKDEDDEVGADGEDFDEEEGDEDVADEDPEDEEDEDA